MRPYQILETWRWGPKGRYASNIGEQLCEITEKLGLVPLKNDRIQRNANPAWESLTRHAEVRMSAVPQSQGTGWHQDGDTTISRDEMDFALVLWANRDHTEFKIPHDKGSNIWQPKPFELVIIRNLAGYHRRPPGLEGRRFHFRQRVEVPSWL